MKKVRIKEDLSATEYEYGVLREMREMKGKIYDIETEYPDSYIVNGWEFAKQDCEIIDNDDTQPTYDDKQVSIGNSIITYDFAKDMTPREIATMLLLLQKQGITKQQIKDMADDNKIKIGDKVFINYTCECGEQSKNGVYLSSDMLKYNHTIQTISSPTSKGFYLKNIDYSFAEEWLTKVKE